MARKSKKKNKNKLPVPVGSERALDETQSDGEARVGQLKREFANHPSKGLTPEKLHRILEAAEQGDLSAQSELFEDMEEKDPQIGADMAKRRQAAAELEWQISAPDGATALERKAADFCSEVFSSIEVEDLVVDMGSAFGHGWAQLELPWDRDGQERRICQPILRPHSWFALDQFDQNKIVIKGLQGEDAELWPLGWISHRHKAKPGYVARSGLHRMLAWPYLFQNYALGDLAQLLEIYGLPARIGTYPRGASSAEKSALLRAVVSLGQSAAGIIPEGMKIDFLNAAEGRADVFQAMMDWCERAKAKVILGGTLTSGTGEGTNTNALGNVHERGLNSLIRSDVRQLAGTVRRDILWPMAALNFGIEDINRAPKFWLDTDETEDYKALSETLPTFVDMGMKIPMWWVHEKTRIPKATDQDEVLQAKAKPVPVTPAENTPGDQDDIVAARIAALKSDTALASDIVPAQIEAGLKDDQAAVWIEQIRKVVDEVDSLEALRNRLVEMTAELGNDGFADALAEAMAAAHLAGRYDLMEGN